VAATYNTIVNMTDISRGILPPLRVEFFTPLEPNWTQVASTSPSVDAPDSVLKQPRTRSVVPSAFIPVQIGPFDRSVQVLLSEFGVEMRCGVIAGR